MERSYDDLFRRHRPRVLRLCRSLLADSSEAQDVAQEVFLQLAREWEAGHPPIACGAWLTRVAINTCRRRRRSSRWQCRTADGVFDEMDLPDAAATPEEQAIGRERWRSLDAAFNHLPPRQRQVFELHHLVGLSMNEVATRLGLSSGTVKRHLFRAHHAFRRVLRRRR